MQIEGDELNNDPSTFSYFSSLGGTNAKLQTMPAPAEFLNHARQMSLQLTEQKSMDNSMEVHSTNQSAYVI